MLFSLGTRQSLMSVKINSMKNQLGARKVTDTYSLLEKRSQWAEPVPKCCDPMNKGKKSRTFCASSPTAELILSLINSGQVLAPCLLLNSKIKSRIFRFLCSNML